MIFNTLLLPFHGVIIHTSASVKYIGANSMLGSLQKRWLLGLFGTLATVPNYTIYKYQRKHFVVVTTPPPLLLGLWDRFCWRLHFNLKRCYLLLLPLLSGVLQSGVFCHSIADVGSLGNCTPGDTL